MKIAASIIPALTLCASFANADAPVIKDIKASKSGASWQFSVTLSHGDTGWDDYADGWRVLALDGTELGLRVLHHPHVNEQPFTRSLGGVTIPDGTREVMIEARDNVGGWSGTPVKFTLPE